MVDSKNIFYDKVENRTPLYGKCLRFYKRYKTNKKRLLAILENILKNGEFTP